MLNKVVKDWELLLGVPTPLWGCFECGLARQDVIFCTLWNTISLSAETQEAVLCEKCFKRTNLVKNDYYIVDWHSIMVENGWKNK